MDPWFHGEEVCAFLEDLDRNSEDGLLLMPRGTGKSGMVTQCMPAWTLAKHPHKRVFIGNAEEKRAQNMARTNANTMRSNSLYRKCFPHVRPSGKWGDDGFFLDTSSEDSLVTVERIDPSLRGYGIRSNVTGSHINGLMILDDLINDESSKSPEQLKRAERFFKECINLIDPGTPLRMCATRWNYHDLYGKIEKGELQGRQGRIRVLRLGITRNRKKRDGTIEKEILFPLRKWKDNFGAEHEVGFTWDTINALRKQLRGMFSSLYMNNPVLDEDVLFDVNMLKRFKHINDLPFQVGGTGRVLVEAEAGGKALISTIQLMMRQENRRLAVEPVTTRLKEKKSRIMGALQPWIASGKFNIREDDWQREDGGLGEELRTFPKGHDDCLDAHTYCIDACSDTEPGLMPTVSFAVDPAFTDEDYSDWTAIAAGCKYDGEYYALETIRFQTNRAEVIVRMLFNIVDKYVRLAAKPLSQRRGSAIVGFSSSQSKPRSRRRRSFARGKIYHDGHTFDISDLSVLHGKGREEK